jgi:enoyl-CoA hydratase
MLAWDYRPGNTMLEVNHDNGIVILHMRHGKANALDTELCVALKDALEQSQSTAKAVVLTGEGKIFSAGVDLVRLLESDDYRRALLQSLAQVLDRLFFYPRPVVAAINGHAIAGGCILACATDHRVMVQETARIGAPELLVGVPFPALALEIMRASAAPHHLQQLMYRGLTCEPAQALAWGLVDELVDKEQVLARALERAREFADIPTRSFELTKLQTRLPSRERLVSSATQEADAQVLQAWNSPEVVTAIRHYVERTLGK